ncbi:hypothetical protein ACQKP0_02730 [Heyndrickxia sp. NPDC080065]|uniref:hypothetical protein n=1 Tax=Heyndrickxia sp. NPDC080065 TaxID=3390568 RepID=UPI003D081C63
MRKYSSVEIELALITVNHEKLLGRDSMRDFVYRDTRNCLCGGIKTYFDYHES